MGERKCGEEKNGSRQVNRAGVNNLYHYDHPEGFRSCYTLVEFEGFGVCPLILDLKDHNEHARVFGHE
jgi:hypothetical protein